MTQLNIFENKSIKTENTLTTRQWRLYSWLKQHAQEKPSRKDILKGLDSLYGYSQEKSEYPNRTFSNMLAPRELTRDIRALKKSPTIQKVIINGRLAVDEDEAGKALKNERIKILKALKLNYEQFEKLSLNGQTRFQLNQEKPIWESVMKMEGIGDDE